VQVVSADYDVAVRTAASQCELARGLLIQDTAWEGYEQIPLVCMLLAGRARLMDAIQDIVHGYTRLFAELDDQLPARSPTHVVVPVGVGSLAHAAVLWYHPLDNVKLSSTTIITVEPSTAACLQTSLARGESISIITSNTIMPGLNCGTVSSLAWPDLKRSIKPQDAVAVTDDEARQAMVELKELGVSAGPCGAASLAALRHCNFGPDDVVVLICTEGQQ
jgi:diaminopropionate ammonia-lyase